MELAAIEALKVLTNAFSVGLAAYRARQQWKANAAELLALETLVGRMGKLIGTIPGMSGAGFTRLVAIHTALVTRAFAIACHEHWGGSKMMAPGVEKPSWLSRQFMSQPEADRRGDIESRLVMAIDSLAEPIEDGHAQAFARISSLLTEPLASPYYGALWKAFTNPLLDDGERANLLELEDPGARLEFERFFRLAYAETIASSVGAELARGLLELESSRSSFLREVIVRWVSGWRNRHVFGDEQTPGVPTMPLGDIYVEPDGVYNEDRRAEKPSRCEPIRSLIRDLLEKNKLVIVRGDFGQGKSLTARMLASEWAEKYFAEKEIRSSELWYPLFIKCSEDFSNHEPTLGRVIRRALQRQARAIEIDLPLDDVALDVPTGGERVVYIIDGFDEVALTRGEVDEFFRNLSQSIGGNGRAIVFSRKGVIPQSAELRGVPIIDLGQFRAVETEDGGQIADWLERWNRLSGRVPITVGQLEERSLIEIARTPILLFMTALTWEERRTDDAPVTRAEIYEKFFRQIAVGKCQQDQDEHKPVMTAAGRILTQLVERGELEKAQSDVPEREQYARAMLWTLARIAWEMQRCVERNEDLTLHEVTDILKEDLGIRNDPSALEVIKVGVLLVLQADQQGGNDRILFGHKSFREFLVARYWSSRLRKIVAARYDNRRKFERQLLGARLLGYDDESFVFLMEIVNGAEWNSKQRQDLVEWAGDAFNDERGDFDEQDAMFWRNDRRPVLREAALAIGSRTNGSRGITAENELTLRTLLGSFWLHDVKAQIIGPRLKSAGAYLSDAVFAGADLEGADLESANLVSADFTAANLGGAALKGADLSAAHLREADLVAADLEGADLEWANLEEANLARANLVDARLAGARLNRARFVGANLKGANLTGASLREAVLEGVRLEGACLARVHLEGAKLENADFEGANLEGADLTGADLTGANLSGVNLAGARLNEVCLANANLAGANLAGANLSATRLSHVNLDGAILTGANLMRSNLAGASLKGACLEQAFLAGANLVGVRTDKRTTWPKGFSGPV